MPKLPTIAVIENDEALRTFLIYTLRSEKYTVWGAASAEEFYRTWAVSKTQVVTLDLGLPGEDGISVLNHLRQDKDITIIVITGRTSTQERIEGLEAGADHYLTKPVYKRELLAAIEASQWRKQSDKTLPTYRSAPLPEAPPQWFMHPSLLMITLPDGRSLNLSEREGLLLACLLNSPGGVVSRDKLHAATFPGYVENNRQIDVIISRLRDKATRELAVSLPIRTIFGKGFTFINAD
jgi:two-component system response regulator PhoP